MKNQSNKSKLSNKSKQWIKIAVVVLIIFAGSLVIMKIPGWFHAVKINKSGNETPAPQFTVKSINYPNKFLSLTKYKGKIILVNFFATWCPPCRAEMPGLEKFYEAHKNDGFRIIGLSVNNSGHEAVLNFFKHFDNGHIKYPIAMANRRIEKAYGGINEIPQSFIINKQGYIAAHFTGELPPGFLNYYFKKYSK
ncbi:MAG: TlpA disulfide reductase family protein [bacterium]